MIKINISVILQVVHRSPLREKKTGWDGGGGGYSLGQGVFLGILEGNDARPRI